MSAWEVSPILAPLIAEVKAELPGVQVVGTIGDEQHAEEDSDHNPDEWGFVCAGDFMKGAEFTAADAEYLFDRITEMIRAGDKRCAYAIYNRRIVSSTVSPGVVRTYTGDDPHTGHVHVSVPHGSQPHPTTSWHIYPPEAPTMALTPADLDAIVAKLATAAGLANPPAGSYAWNERKLQLTYPSNFSGGVGAAATNLLADLKHMYDAQASILLQLGQIAAAMEDLNHDPADGGPSEIQRSIAAAVWLADNRTLTE